VGTALANSRPYRVPAACICTPAGLVSIFHPEPDTEPSVTWIIEGPRDALELLLPGLIHRRDPVVRGLVQLAVLSQRRPRRRR
jgi:hypothetical protein